MTETYGLNRAPTRTRLARFALPSIKPRRAEPIITYPAANMRTIDTSLIGHPFPSEVDFHHPVFEIPPRSAEATIRVLRLSPSPAIA